MFPGLELQVADGNVVEIHPDCKFTNSKIFVTGKGNRVTIMPSLSYDGFTLKFVGSEKIFSIAPTWKKVNNLKVISIRGDRQRISIDEGVGVGGLEMQLNDGCEEICIGKYCLFSWGIKMRTSDGHSVVDIATNRAINTPKNIFIGEHVWVGEDVRFLKGASVAADSVVGSASVVTKSFVEPNVVIAGFPADIVRRGITWDRRRPSQYNSEVGD